MRYDRLRRVLVVLVIGLIFLPPALLSEQETSPLRSAHFSSLSGAVMVKRPGATEAIPAQPEMPIEEGFEVSTSGGGTVTLQMENGSTVHLGELTKVVFTQLSADTEGNKLTAVTLDQGHAEFHFSPEREDAYKVKIADSTLVPRGRADFQASFLAGKVQTRVLAGSVTISAHSGSLTLGKGKFLEYHPSDEPEVAKSHARVVRLSYVSGTVMLRRPGSTQEEKALLNTPIQEGFELSTSATSYAEVEFENGSTARMGEQSKLLFHQLALDANGNKLNGMTFEQGYATFHFFIPEHSSENQRGQNGAIRFQPDNRDVYHVKIADTTVTPDGKCEFRTDLMQDRFRVEVFNGSVSVTTANMATKVSEGKILEHQPNSAELALNTQKGIVKDAWDQWTEARDKQVLLTQKDEPVHPNGPSYGWSDLDTYGEWVRLPGGRLGWSPYAAAGWSPYTNGMWDWYAGFGWTWISGEPWGWVTDHCGLWDFDLSFGWYWMNPMFGCGSWWPSLVTWYGGPGWIGWQPAGPVHPRPVPPGHPRPRPPNGVITKVPASLVQNRQMITPQVVSHMAPPAGSRIEHPDFEPSPRPSIVEASTAPSAGVRASSFASIATTSPGATHIGRGVTGFGKAGASAPPSVLVGGNPAMERSLLGGRLFHPANQPLRAAQGATLGGRYAVRGSPGEFRGNVPSGGGRMSGAWGTRGSAGGAIVSHSSGGSGTVGSSHGSGGGGSSGGARGGFSGGSGGHASGMSGGGGASSGGGGHH